MAVTIIAWLFIAVGVMGLMYHSTELNFHGSFRVEPVWVLLVRMLAIIAGVFLLRGRNWARWLVVLWLGYHVGLSVLHTAAELVIHALFLAIITFFLFRPRVSSYFRPSPAYRQAG